MYLDDRSGFIARMLVVATALALGMGSVGCSPTPSSQNQSTDAGVDADSGETDNDSTDCTDDADCDGALVCGDDGCVEQCEVTDCADDELCHRGACYPECSEQSDCGDGDRCAGERCVSRDCEGVDCRDDENCRAGACYPACQGDDECGGDAVCETDVCLEPSCDDGLVGGEETDVDCGGSDCEACEPGETCQVDGDCAVGRCQDETCIQGDPPGAPTDLVVYPGDTEAHLEWEPPAEEGDSPIEDYEVTVYGEDGGDPAGVSGETSRMVGSTETTWTFEGLTNGNTYAFGVRAENDQGPGPESDLSDPVTPQPALVTVWDTDRADFPGLEHDELSLPVQYDGNYDFHVDWGDGTREHVTHYSDADHTYEESGTYTVELVGEVDGWALENDEYAPALLAVKKWGPLQFGDEGSNFYGAEHLQITAEDTPNLEGTTNLAWAFKDCSSLGTIPSLEDWDTSDVTRMEQMFRGATYFEDPDDGIGDWDTSQVEDMEGMFLNAENFDADIGDWDTSAVDSMEEMFRGATSFNRDIGDWDTSELNYMNNMFAGAESFDQDLDEWETGDVFSMFGVFRDAESFDGDISTWDTGEVDEMRVMFQNAESFDGDISGWDTGQVESFTKMFDGAVSFDRDIGGWDTSSAEYMTSMFQGAESFDQDLGDWNVTGLDGTSAIQTMNAMFVDSALSTSNYDAILTGWADQDVGSSVELGAGDVQYSPAAADARQTLVEEHNWTISDGGQTE